MMKTGLKAPEILLRDKDDKEVRLSAFAGKKVVVYFYPRDNTAGCLRQAVAFAAAYDEFREMGIEVIGISKDSVVSHHKFADKYQLPFILLSDPELKTIKEYGVWQEKKLYGKSSMGVVRTTLLIDKDGNIEKVWAKANPDNNAKEILEYLKGK